MLTTTENNTTLWSQKELQILFNGLQLKHNPMKIQRDLFEAGFKRSLEAIYRKTKSTRNERKSLVTPGIPTSSQVFTEKAVVSSVLTTKTLNFSSADQYVDAIKSLVNKTPYREPVKAKDPSSESFVMLLSDHHCGKKVQGLPSIPGYDLQTWSKRVDMLYDHAMSIFKYTSKGVLFDEVVVIFDGDMVDGEGIYPTQPHHIEINAVEQVFSATQKYWEMLKNIQTYTGLPVRVCCVDGNHGRTHKTNDEKTNWDRVLYYNLYLLANEKADSMITVDVSEADYLLVDIKGWTGYIKHILPMSAASSSNRDRFAAWDQLHKFDFACGGHYHSSRLDKFHSKPVFYNGSLVGMDDFSEKIAKVSLPSQWLFGVSSKRVVTFMYEINF